MADERPAPILHVVFDALIDRGWAIADHVYIDPEGNRYGSVEAALMAQSAREIGIASERPSHNRREP